MRSKKEEDDDETDNVRTAEAGATRLFHDGRATRSSRRRFRAHHKGVIRVIVHWVLILSVLRATSVPLFISKVEYIIH